MHMSFLKIQMHHDRKVKLTWLLRLHHRTFLGSLYVRKKRWRWLFFKWIYIIPSFVITTILFLVTVLELTPSIHRWACWCWCSLIKRVGSGCWCICCWGRVSICDNIIPNIRIHMQCNTSITSVNPRSTKLHLVTFISPPGLWKWWKLRSKLPM